MTLANLKLGEEARVRDVTIDVPLIARRILDLGITPGAAIRAELSNAGAAARAYRVRGALVAIRREHADGIQIEKLGR